MNTHTNKKVVCVKDIPSNLIEEAIFILKTDNVDCKNPKIKSIRKEIIQKETEALVNEYSSEFFINKIEENEKIYSENNVKMKILLGIIGMVLVCCLVSLII